MSEKTEAFSPKFYLYNSSQPLCITHRMTLGRNEGDIILEDTRLSSRHCEFIPKLLELFVVDLNSTNGVFVNKQKIFPNTEVKLNQGDEVRIGGFEFTFYDSEEAMKRIRSQGEPIVEGEGFKVSHLLSFFSVSKGWTGLYLAMILSAVASLVTHLQVDTTLPSHLDFLSKFYQANIWPQGLKIIFLVWGLSLVHGYLVSHIFTNQMGKFISTIPYLAIVFAFVNLADGPVWAVKHYAQNWQTVKEGKEEDKPILRLKKWSGVRGDLKKSYEEIIKKLNDDDKKALEADYRATLNTVDDKISKISPPRT